MAHARTQIRNQIKSWIESLPEFAGKVQSGRNTNAQYSELPLITIFAGDENSRIVDVAGSLLEREFQLVIEIKLKDHEIDDAMDALALKIESVIDQRRSPATLWHTLDLAATRPSIDDTGADVVGELRLIYTVKYDTDAQDASQTR